MGKVRIVVWTYDSFETISKLKHCFTKYLKESCGLCSDQHCLIKYFLKNTVVSEFFQI